MSEIIRDAIIRLKLETQRSRIEMPEVDKISRAYEDQRIKSEQVRVSVEQTQRSVQESTKVHQEFGQEAVKSFRHGLEGTIQFARGVALMTASGEQDTRKLLEAFAKIEAATALIKGAVNLAKFGAAFGPVGTAVATVTALVGAGIVAWGQYRGEIEATKKRLEEAKQALEEYGRALEERINSRASREQGVAGLERAARAERIANTTATGGDRLGAVSDAFRKTSDDLGRLVAERKDRLHIWGDDSDEVFQQLLKGGQRTNLTEALGIEQRRLDILRERTGYAQEIVKLEREKEQKTAAEQLGASAGIAAAAGVLPFGGGIAVSGLGASQQQQQAAEFSRQWDKLLKDQQIGMNALTDAFQTAVDRIVALQRALDAANP